MKKSIVLMTLLAILAVTSVSVMAGGGLGSVLAGFAYIDDVQAPDHTIVKVFGPDMSMVANGYTNSLGFFGWLTINEDGLSDGDLLTFTINDLEANGSIEYNTGMKGIVDIYAYTTQAACPTEEDRLTVETDKTDYDQGEQVTISGTLLDEDCNPIADEDIAIQINDPYDNPLAVQATTNAQGYYEYVHSLDTDALLGTYTVTANGNGDTAQTSFDVAEAPVQCEEDWTCTSWAPAVCDITELQTCTSWTDLNDCGTEDNKPTEETRSCVYECEEDWTCTSWAPEVCDSTEIQTCTEWTDLEECGTENDKPTEETRECECVPVWGEWSAWSSCSSEGVQTRSRSDSWCGLPDDVDTQECVYNPDCSIPENRITVETDKTDYYVGEQVTVSGHLLDENCDPVVGQAMIVSVKMTGYESTPLDTIYSGTGGLYSYTFTLEDDALYYHGFGGYEVSVNAGDGVYGSEDFNIIECVEDWMYTEWSMCLPTNEQIRFGYDMNQCGTTADKEALTQECTFEGPTDCTGFYMEIMTDMPYYEGASNGAVYGFLLDEDCNPINGADIDLLGEPNLFEETVQTVAGVFSYEFSLGELNEYGQYTVTATYNGGVPVGPVSVQTEVEPVTDETTFYYVETCDADGDTHTIPECGGDDCNDGNAAVYPGASCETGCSNTGATYDATCACTGGTDTCYKGGGGGTYGGGGGYYSCTPQWVCTYWTPADCPESEEQTRTCEDTNKCGTDTNKPAETQTCTYLAPPKFEGPLVVCGDGACEGDETCNTCESDCGTCPIPPTGAICGNSICESTENCEKCESDCGKCQEPELPAAGQDGLTGLVPGGVAGIGGIAILIIAIIGIGYFYSVRKK